MAFDVTVGDGKIEPAIQIDVAEDRAEAEPVQTRHTQAGAVRPVVEAHAARVQEEDVRHAVKVGHEQ